VFVSLRAHGRSFIVFDDDQRRVAECDDDCEFWAWPGSYRVQLQKNEHEHETSVRLRVRHSGSYTLDPGNEQAADGGLALGVVGSLVAVVGSAVMFAGELSYDCVSEDAADNGAGGNCKTPPSVYYGLTTLAVGAGMTTVGFVLYGGNHTGFHFESEPVPLRYTARFGPVPLPRGGLGLGATLAF